MPRSNKRSANNSPSSSSQEQNSRSETKGTSIGDLIIESHEIEEAASRIQRGEQVGLSPVDINTIVQQYDDWYARCLSMLPDLYRGRFEAEYEGKWHAPGIRRFLEQPAASNPLHSKDSGSVFSYWLYPYDTAFRSRIRAQRQILREVEIRQTAAAARQASNVQQLQREVVEGTVFIVMPMNKEDPMLDDVHDAIKQVATQLGMSAERVDEPHTNIPITDRILEQLAKAEYVVADLTHNRPNVYYEAGYAHALGKTPIYIAREGTHIEFDLKDFPILFFNNIRQLREMLAARLKGLSESKTSTD